MLKLILSVWLCTIYLFLIVTRTLNWEKYQNENNCYNCSSAQSSAFNGCANNYTQPQPGEAAWLRKDSLLVCGTQTALIKNCR